MSTYVVAGRIGFHSNHIGLHIGQTRPMQKPTHAVLTWEEHEEGDFVPEAVTMTTEAAQELMDSLWQCGLRPSEGSGSAGALAATQRHLEDLRALVFKKK